MVQRFIGPLTNDAVAEGTIFEGGTSQLQASPYLVRPHLPLEKHDTPAERRIVVDFKTAGHMFTAGAEREKVRE